MEATVISIYPKEVREKKPGLIPEEYIIPPGTPKEPSSAIIGDATFFHHQPLGMPAFRSVAPGEEVAKSIVNDFIKAQLKYDTNSHPGLMWIPGTMPMDTFKFKHKDDLKALEQRQTRWFIALIKDADDDWRKFHQHRMISDIQRFAAEQMKLVREWMKVDEAADMLDCKACGTRIPNFVVVCPNCRVIVDPEKAKGLVFAGGA